jgi:hypothetical protein
VNGRNCRVAAGLCALALAGAWAPAASAQVAEVKERPPMYTYEANWSIPRARWAEMDKANASDQKVLEKALADGVLVAYGDDAYVIHEVDGATHDDWWSAMSMAGVLHVLDEIYKAGGAAAPVLASATKHWDNLYVSRYYNWRRGSWKGAYTHWASYPLKADAPRDAVDALAKGFIVPLLEKLLAEGAIVEYEIDVEAIHTDNPAVFAVAYIAPAAEGLDKVETAVHETLKTAPLVAPARDAIIDLAKHRDVLVRSTATYR